MIIMVYNNNSLIIVIFIINICKNEFEVLEVFLGFLRKKHNFNLLGMLATTKSLGSHALNNT